MPPLDRITILGGGLTGLTTAYRLARVLASLPPADHGPHAGTEVTLLEKTPRIGGWVRSSPWVVTVPREDGGVRDVEVMLEAGPRSIRPKGSVGAAYMLKLIQDLNLEPEILAVPLNHPSARNRFILSRTTNALVRLPSGIPDLLGLASSGSTTTTPDGKVINATDTSEEKSLRKILRRGILSDLFRARSPPPATPTTTTPAPGARDTTVHTLVSQTLGPRVANTLISAMVHGIYAADSRTLSVRSTFPVLWDAMYGDDRKKTGSLVWNLVSSAFFGRNRRVKTLAEEEKVREEADAWASLGSLDDQRKKWSVYGLKGGLGVLTDKMQLEAERAGVRIVTGCQVGDLRVGQRGEVSLSLSTGDEPSTTHETDLLISTLSPSTLDSLLEPTQRLPHLQTNPSTNVGVVNIVYPLPSHRIHPAGFGYLIPRAPEDDGLPPAAGQPSIPNTNGILGVVFDSTTVPVDPTPDAAEHVTKLTLMIGGPHWRTEADIPSEAKKLEALAIEHLGHVFPVLRGVEPVITRSWIQRECIPTYLPGHGARLRQIHEILAHDGKGKGGKGKGKGGSEWAGKLVLAGSGYGGVGVNDCVGSAEGVVRALEKRWRREAEGEGEARFVTGLERWEAWE